MKLPETDQEVYELLTDEEREMFTADTAPVFRKLAKAKALLKAVASSPAFMAKDLFDSIESFVYNDKLPPNLDKIISVEHSTLFGLSDIYYYRVYKVEPRIAAGYLNRWAECPTIETLGQLYGNGVYNIFAINKTSNQIIARTQIGVNQ